MKSGGNSAENTFSVIKRNLTRMNFKGRTTTARLNFLSAAWLAKHCGLEGVALAIKIYQDNIIDKTNPKLAFKSVEWLRTLEQVD
jgi:hypothetical protein